LSYYVLSRHLVSVILAGSSGQRMHRRFARILLSGRIGKAALSPDIKVMSTNVGHFFTLEILPSQHVAGHYT